MPNILVIPAYRGAYKSEAEVLRDWDNNKAFCTPEERTSYMSKSDYERYGNALDGIVYSYKGLHVLLKMGIL